MIKLIRFKLTILIIIVSLTVHHKTEEDTRIYLLMEKTSHAKESCFLFIITVIPEGMATAAELL